jgi:photosystem II stability/assembly factor-like uncharacterized protein
MFTVFFNIFGIRQIYSLLIAKRMKKQLLFFAAIFIYSFSFSQDYRQMMTDPEANLFDVQKAFHSYWKDKDSTQKGNGYKVFKRWEHYVEPRVYPSGNLSQLSLTSKNYSDFLKNNSNSNSKITSTTWTARGCFGALNYPAYPQYVAAGRIDFLRVDPNNTSILYTGSPSGGLWKSTDGGLTWNTNTDLLSIIGCSDLAIDPSNSNILYLATGDGITGYSNSIGLLKSIDGGLTWNTTGLTYTVSQGRRILRILVNPSNSQVLIASTSLGIFRSTDGGATWNLSINISQSDLEFKPTDPNTVYAAGYYGFYMSTDGGITFNQISAGIPTSNIGGMAIAVTPADINYVYAVVTSTNGGFGGFYQSTTAGVSFVATNTSTYNILGYSPTTAGGQGSYNLCIDASPNFKNIVTVGGIYPWYTTDSGTSWTQLTSATTPNYIHPDTHDIVYDPLGTSIYIANDGGLHKYNSGNINNLCSNMNIGEIYKIGSSYLTPDLWITGLQDNGTSMHTSSTYSLALGADGMDCFFDRTTDQNVFGCIQYGGLQISNDGGATWYSPGAGLSTTPGWVAPWHQDPAVPTRIYHGRTEMFVSNNLGLNWTMLSLLPSTSTILEFEIAPSNNQIIYVLKSNGALLRTTNAGSSWTNVTGTLPISVARGSHITIDPTDPNNVWITCSGYSPGNKVFVTTTGGAVWTNVSYNLPNIPANCSVYLPGSNDAVYIGMDVGVYYKDNSMTSWLLYNTGLPNVEISELDISPASPTKLRAATYGRGVYEVDILAPPVSNFSVAAIPFCSGQNIQFSDLSTFSPSTWNWNVSPSAGVTIISASFQNPQINFPAAGTYSVSLTASNASGPGTTVTQTITVNAPPTMSVAAATQTICTGEYVVFSVSGASTYTWSNGGGNNTLAIYSPTTASTYTVWGENSNGCIAAVPLSVAVDPCIGINELNNNGVDLSVYPNPNQGTFIVETKIEAEIVLYNSLGAEILNKKIKTGKTELNISSYSNGIYYLRSVIGNKTKVVKLVKDK